MTQYEKLVKEMNPDLLLNLMTMNSNGCGMCNLYDICLKNGYSCDDNFEDYASAIEEYLNMEVKEDE